MAKTRSPFRVLVGTAILLSVAGLWSQPGPSYPAVVVFKRPNVTMAPDPNVETLLNALRDSSVSVRQKAAQALLHMGIAIRPQLQWALESERNAVPADSLNSIVPLGAGFLVPRHAVHELVVLLDRLDEERARAGSVMTLHYKNAPLTDVLRDLGQQADTDVAAPASYTPQDWVHKARATVNVDRGGFWEAIAQIEQSAGVVFTRGGGTLSFTQGTAESRRVFGTRSIAVPFGSRRSHSSRARWWSTRPASSHGRRR